MLHSLNNHKTISASKSTAYSKCIIARLFNV